LYIKLTTLKVCITFMADWSVIEAATFKVQVHKKENDVDDLAYFEQCPHH